MKLPVVRMTLIERLVVCFIAFLLVEAIDWSFIDLAMLWTGALVSAFLAITARNKIALSILSLLAACASLAAAFHTTDLFPLSKKISGGDFYEAPLSSVLQHLAKQKQTRPHWVFYLGEDLAQVKV